MHKNIPNEVFHNYSHLGQVKDIKALDSGLINKTYKISTDKSSYILQEVSPIFKPELNIDIGAITNHLAKKNILTPHILPTNLGEPCLLTFQKMFRAQSFIDGKSIQKITNPSLAHEAGLVLAKFHFALHDFSYEYRHKRIHGADYLAHMNNLLQALNTHKTHEFYKDALELSEPMLFAMDKIIKIASLRKRHSHGDLKISNVLFDKEDKGLCLVDLDTIGHNAWSLDLADAFRSWSNPFKEDDLRSFVDLNIIQETLKGYSFLMKDIISSQELDEIVIHSQGISLCLSIRYLADTLNESYFSFDSKKYPRASMHNLIRAKSMWNLYKHFCNNELKISKILKNYLG